MHIKVTGVFAKHAWAGVLHCLSKNSERAPDGGLPAARRQGRGRAGQQQQRRSGCGQRCAACEADRPVAGPVAVRPLRRAAPAARLLSPPVTAYAAPTRARRSLLALVDPAS